MIKHWLCLLVLIINSSGCFSQEHIIRFNVTPLGFPPYVMNSPPSGIMYDVLNYIAHHQEMTLEVQRIPEGRVPLLLDNNKLDAHASAIEWMPTPQKYAFTDPVLQVRDVIFTRKDYVFDYRSAEDLFGHNIGVRTGYSYQSLTHYFEKGEIHRSDSNSELYLLQLLARERLNIAIITEHVGLWQIKKNNLKTIYAISKNAVDTTDYRIVMSKKWLPFIRLFNQELAVMKSNGTLENILNKYR